MTSMSMHWHLRLWIGDGLDMGNLSFVKADPRFIYLKSGEVAN